MNYDETHAQAHEKAIAAMTAESYLLGELSDAEADAFEQHYFDCRVCAGTIRAGTAMFAAGRAVMKEDPVPVPEPVPAFLPAPLPFRKRAPQWLSVAASAVLAFSLGIQSPWLRPAASLPMMEVASPGPLITSTMRGSSNDETVIRMEGDRAVAAIISASSEPLDPAYRVILRDASGKVIHSIALTPQQAFHEDGVPVLLRALPAGRYFLAIEGVRKEGNRLVVRKSVVVQ